MVEGARVGWGMGSRDNKSALLANNVILTAWAITLSSILATTLMLQKYINFTVPWEVSYIFHYLFQEHSLTILPSFQEHSNLTLT